MSNPLEKILALIKHTGDNCIVVDADGNPVYAVMDFAKYEKLYGHVAQAKSDSVVGLTEDQLLAKINQDIADWKASTDSTDSANLDTVDSMMREAKSTLKTESIIEEKSLNQAKNSQDSGKPEEKYYFEPID